MEHHPAFHWARANGWAIMAMAELLEVLPADHPVAREDSRAVPRARRGAHRHAGACGPVAPVARSPRVVRGDVGERDVRVRASRAASIAAGWMRWRSGRRSSLGWNAVATKVNAKGQVEGTCVGTGVGWDPMFYMYRPVHVLAAHGYGPVLLAGAEMIELRKTHPDIGVHDGGVQFGKALEVGVR